MVIFWANDTSASEVVIDFPQAVPAPPQPSNCGIRAAMMRQNTARRVSVRQRNGAFERSDRRFTSQSGFTQIA
jgi:hypothetical protein